MTEKEMIKLLIGKPDDIMTEEIYLIQFLVKRLQAIKKDRLTMDSSCLNLGETLLRNGFLNKKLTRSMDNFYFLILVSILESSPVISDTIKWEEVLLSFNTNRIKAVFYYYEKDFIEILGKYRKLRIFHAFEGINFDDIKITFKEDYGPWKEAISEILYEFLSRNEVHIHQDIKDYLLADESDNLIALGKELIEKIYKVLSI